VDEIGLSSRFLSGGMRWLSGKRGGKVLCFEGSAGMGRLGEDLYTSSL
jgi:hypothetical protein